MATAQDVARFFIDYGEKSNERMTNMRVNKLLYFAQGVHLSQAGQPLFPDELEAWPFGPVVASVYHQYKRFDSRPIIDAEAGVYRDSFTESEYGSLLDTARIYGVFTTSTLVDISHKPGGPWAVTMKTTEHIIAKDLIQKEFSETNFLRPFVLPLDAIDIINKRDANGILILPREDDDEEWSEYDEV